MIERLRESLWEWRCRLDLRRRATLAIVRNRSLIARGKVIADYFQNHPVAKVQIGCGFNLLKGWLNTDFEPCSGAIFLDATKPLPFANSSVDYVFSEHMFEHIPYKQGGQFLREAFRALKPGGKIRIATPDLAFLIRLYLESETDLARRYIQQEVDRYIPFPKAYTKGNVVNNFFRNWGHQFIYDFEMLSLTLSEAGFVDPRRFAPKESDDAQLRNLESHGRVIGDEFNQFESIVVEARKP